VSAPTSQAKPEDVALTPTRVAQCPSFRALLLLLTGMSVFTSRCFWQLSSLPCLAALTDAFYMFPSFCFPTCVFLTPFI